MDWILKTLPFLFLSTFLHAQENHYKIPDYDLIKRDIQDSTSRYYYPDLIQKYFLFDTTLTTDEYRHLYYGYIFQTDYKPNWESPTDEKILEIIIKSKISQKDLDEMLELAYNAVRICPFDLRNINWLQGAYSMRKDYAKAKLESIRFEGLMNAIMSSGDGKSCETGIHLISIYHEKVVVPFEYNSFVIKAKDMIDGCDNLLLMNSNRTNMNLYFVIKGK